MTTLKYAQIVISVIVVLALGIFVGCSDDEKTPLVTPPPPIQPPEKEKLMEIFTTTYENMLIEDFEEILHEDFKLKITNGTISQWGLLPESFIYKGHMRDIHANMFGGVEGMGPGGSTVNPLDHIEVILFERVNSWTEALDDDPHFTGSMKALYNVRIRFHDNTGTHAFEINNNIFFYADQVGDYWYLSGIKEIEHSTTKAIEDTSYDMVLYLYNSITG